MIHPYFDSNYIFPLLRASGLLSQAQIEELLPKVVIAKRKGQDIVQWLDSLKIPRADSGDKQIPLDEADILAVIARDRNWPFRRLDPLKLDIEVVTKTLSSSFARKRLVLPLKWHGDELEICTYYPGDRELKEDLERACQVKTRMSVAPKKDIEGIIREFFDFKRSIAAAEDILATPAVDISNLEQYVRLMPPDSKGSDKYINQAVDHLFQYAMDQRASDIHIEPKRSETHVRLRIDGVLHTVYRLPRAIHDALCTRIKAMSRLDIAEKRRPQDGRLKIARRDYEAEVRVSTVPVAFGEKVVLRLQSAEILFSALDELGFAPTDLATYKAFLQRNHGMILMTGPTGSGKSTTLYSTLRYLSSPDVNIVTVEDPIEMVYEDFNQIAVQPQIGVTFASILRNILRQDPDIVMIGEIRDVETARYAVQAALTGHMVFSTLHTNDAAGAVTRLRDLGLEPYLIASTLIGIVAQRLVRKVCTRCARPASLPAERLAAIGCNAGASVAKIMQGQGCNICRGTGYFGRVGIYEVLPVSEKIRKIIHDSGEEQQIRRQAIESGMTTLRQDACRKLLKGITTMEEVIRAVG